MKTSKEEKQAAYEYLKQFRNKPIAAIVKSVSKSGMSRRIEFCVEGFTRIGFDLAKCLEYPYDPDKGMLVTGCGMDMIFHVISSFNYFAAFIDTGKTLQALRSSNGKGYIVNGVFYERIYDCYFFDADKYRTL